MPTYTYGCKKCGHEFDVFHGISANPALRCESCDSAKVERHLGTGAGIIFKGSGFYETDFKDKKGKKPGDSKPKAESGKKESAGDSSAAPAKSAEKKKVAPAASN